MQNQLAEWNFYNSDNFDIYHHQLEIFEMNESKTESEKNRKISGIQVSVCFVTRKMFTISSSATCCFNGVIKYYIYIFTNRWVGGGGYKIHVFYNT